MTDAFDRKLGSRPCEPRAATPERGGGGEFEGSLVRLAGISCRCGGAGHSEGLNDHEIEDILEYPIKGPQARMLSGYGPSAPCRGRVVPRWSATGAAALSGSLPACDGSWGWSARMRPLNDYDAEFGKRVAVYRALCPREISRRFDMTAKRLIA